MGMHVKEMALLRMENKLHQKEIELLKKEKELLMKDLGVESDEDEDRGLDDNYKTTERSGTDLLGNSSEGTTPAGTSDDDKTKSLYEGTAKPKETSDDETTLS